MNLVLVYVLCRLQVEIDITYGYYWYIVKVEFCMSKICIFVIIKCVVCEALLSKESIHFSECSLFGFHCLSIFLAKFW